ncbi:MAG: Plug domain-containing protein, partial [Cyclobacteriaceae bacterium]|nr:Plug domain-containing protein [Cyclobacteriaceae bacterium]
SYKEDPLHLQTLTGKTNISSERMAQIPAMLGTTDIMRAITFLPGITNGREGTTQIFVRGGGQDQNLILVDEAPVYTSSHMGGFVSIFNNEAIKDVDIYKGGFPARYGGRLSSVLDIKNWGERFMPASHQPVGLLKGQ